MRKEVKKLSKYCLGTGQIFILVLSIFAFMFLINQISVVKADNDLLGEEITVIPAKTGYNPQPGKTFFNVKIGDQSPEIVRWAGTKGGIATGETASGITKTWKAIELDKIKTVDVTSQIPQAAIDNWGKTFDLNGQSHAISDAIMEPKSIPGLIDNGKLTSAGKSALQEAGINNPTINGGKIIPGEALKERGLMGFFKTTNVLGGHLLEGLGWAMTVISVIQLVGHLAGVDQETVNAASIAAGMGIMSGKFAMGLLDKNGMWELGDKYMLTAGQTSLIVGAAVAVITFIALYKKASEQIINIIYPVWDGIAGGNDCEECNKYEYGCSEYRCRSSGNACELLNVGTKQEKCAWVNPKDVASPTITPWVSVLSEGHKYTNLKARPPSLGTKIVRTDTECLKPFSNIKFGLVLSEPAKCKVDASPEKRFDEMSHFLGEGLFLYNHSDTLWAPSIDSVDEANLEKGLGIGGDFNLYVKCQDRNGNENEDAYLISYCVSQTPDTTPPIIEETSLKSGTPVSFGAENVSLQIYVSEPAECKWSTQDKAFLDMETDMNCALQPTTINGEVLFPCTTTLTGIKDRATNQYYFRCKDQPTKPENERNVNRESYDFTLLGSQPLTIKSVAPEGLIADSTEIVKVTLEVETEHGFEEGKSICYFGPTLDDMILMSTSTEFNFKHSQILNLPEGDYDYFFRCLDLGGNTAEANVSFSVETDTETPKVVRAYKEIDALKIITDEYSQCTYSLTDCRFNFEEGIVMKILDFDAHNTHFVEWKPGTTYHIKCEDKYFNRPSPDECSIVASAGSF